MHLKIFNPQIKLVNKTSAFVSITTRVGMRCASCLSRRVTSSEE